MKPFRVQAVWNLFLIMGQGEFVNGSASMNLNTFSRNFERHPITLFAEDTRHLIPARNGFWESKIIN